MVNRRTFNYYVKGVQLGSCVDCRTQRSWRFHLDYAPGIVVLDIAFGEAIMGCFPRAVLHGWADRGDLRCNRVQIKGRNGYSGVLRERR